MKTSSPDLPPVGVCFAPKDIENLPSLPFDFLEVNVQGFLVPMADDGAFEPNRASAGSAARPVRSANCFLPGELQCVGPDVRIDPILEYARTAFRRAGEVGIRTIVFGSGNARMRPDGTSFETAMDQFVELLRRLGPLAEERGVTLVVEPLNRGECNFINSLSEGAEAVERAGHKSVRLLADIYHMRKDGEPEAEIEKFASLIHHVHAAEKEGRSFPGKHGEDLVPYLAALARSNYCGELALECHWGNFAEEGDASLARFRQQMNEAGLRNGSRSST